MNQIYHYGEEISYDFVRIQPEDEKILQAFSCGNEILDKYIRNDIWCHDEYNNKYINEEDGRHFKVVD